jgi:hypothetical protein
VEVVETHIVTNGGFGFATENAYDQWKATDNSGYITSLTRLVVMKYRKSGEMVSFLMTIVGDKEYLETKCFEMWDNTYLTKDKDFSGLALFHSTDGVFVNGWRYTNGKVTHTVDVNFEEGYGISLKSGYYNCSSYPVYGWFQNCTDYYTVGEVDGHVVSITYTGSSCGAPYMDYAGTSIQCTYVDNGSGGGYNPAPPGIKKTFCDAYSGMINTVSLQSNIQYFTAEQEQFIISLANTAALHSLGYPLQSLQTNLTNYSLSSSLYTKLNKLNNPGSYTIGWEPAYNSSTGTNSALISPEIGNSNFRLKYYSEKNGEYNALGLVRDGDAAHTIEGALEYIEWYLSNNYGFADDFLYDMHLFNALNFMNYYCND